MGIIAALLALTSCHHEQKAETNDDEFRMNDSIAQLITIDTVQSHLLQGNLELNGEVTYNDNAVVRVMPLVTGTITEVRVQLGDFVTKGQVMATMRSTELAGLQGELNSNMAELRVAQKALEVAKDLEAKGINSQREVLEAQQEVFRQQADVDAAKKKLSVIGGMENGGEVTILAPQNGYVVDRKVNPNQVVDGSASDPMFVVSDLAQVWVIASVYEADINKVKIGEQVNVHTIAYPDKVYRGTISNITNILDPETKTMKVRVVLDNPNRDLKPEMFARVTLDYEQMLQVAAIPRDALVFDDSKYYVVIYNSKTDVKAQQVELYPMHNDSDGLVYIRSGVSPGTKIVSRNQLLIFNAL